jgi:hypothetical protein
MGNTGTEICESQQTEKCPESLFFTCCHRGLAFSFWANLKKIEKKGSYGISTKHLNSAANASIY